MSRRTLVVLGGVFVMLLGIVFLQGSGIFSQPIVAPTPTPGEPEAQTVFGGEFTAQEIAAIRVGNPASGEELLLVRGDDGAWTAPDLQGELDAETVAVIAGTMELLPYSGTVPITGETELAAFGLADNNRSVLSVQVLLANQEAHALLFGGLTPIQDAYYSIVDDRDLIYLIDPRPVEFLRLQLRNPPVNLTSD